MIRYDFSNFPVFLHFLNANQVVTIYLNKNTSRQGTFHFE